MQLDFKNLKIKPLIVNLVFFSSSLLASMYDHTYAIELDGVENYIDVGIHNDLNISGDLTLEGWFKYESINGVYHTKLIYHGIGYDDTSDATNSLYSFLIDRTTHKLKLEWEYAEQENKDTVESSVSIDSVTKAGIWHHYAVVRDTNDAIGTVTFYVDGQQLGSQRRYSTGAPVGGSDGHLSIGGEYRTSGGSGYFHGQIDEVRIWNIARGSTDIHIDMNHELDGNETGLVAYYNCNGTDTTLTDVTDNRHDGIFITSPTYIKLEAGQEINTTIYSDENVTFIYDFNIFDTTQNWGVEYNVTDEADSKLFDINSSTGILTFKDVSSAFKNSNYNVNITAMGNGEVIVQTYIVSVTSTDTPPLLNPISDIVVLKNSEERNIMITATDADRDALTYYATTLDNWLLESLYFTDDHHLMLKPSFDVTGSTQITVRVTDGDFNVSKNFTYIVSTSDIVEVHTTQEPPSYNIDLGNDVEINATAEINGSILTPTIGGLGITYGDENLSMEINASFEGQVVHRFILKESDIITFATFNFAGAHTIIKEESGCKYIQTSVQVDENATITVYAYEDGSAKYVVTYRNQTTEVNTSISGATTIVNENGSVQTTVGRYDDTLDNTHYYIRSVAKTQPNGMTQTWFERGNRSDDTTVEGTQFYTLDSHTSFGVGDQVTIEEIDSKLYIKVDTTLENNLTIQ